MGEITANRVSLSAAALQQVGVDRNGSAAQNLRQGSNDQGANEVAAQSRGRVCGFFAEAGKRIGAALALPIVGALGVAALAVGATVAVPAYALAKVADGVRACFSGQTQSLAQQMNLDAIDDSILEARIATNEGEKSVNEVLEQYLGAINSPVDAGEMQQFVKMGEQIVRAINEMDNYDGGPIEIGGIQVKPSLETARAVSWFLQAKALVDNASADRPPMLLNRGSMVMADPGNKLANFLKSAPNTYGRASTHFNERSGVIAGFMNAGFAGGLINLKNIITGSEAQGAQLGIEDFGNKFPSGKGCLLFSSLEGKSFSREPLGEGAAEQVQDQLFLKWESAGMPNVIHPKATHFDSEAGYSAKVWGRVMAFNRCIKHTLNFLSSSHQSDWGIHREAVHKGGPQALFEGFKAKMQSLEATEGLQDGWATRMGSDAKKFGLDFMASVLAQFPEDAEAVELLNQIDAHISGQGNDVGILARRGDEIHTSLE